MASSPQPFLVKPTQSPFPKEVESAYPTATMPSGTVVTEVNLSLFPPKFFFHITFPALSYFTIMASVTPLLVTPIQSPVPKEVESAYPTATTPSGTVVTEV